MAYGATRRRSERECVCVSSESEREHWVREEVDVNVPSFGIIAERCKKIVDISRGCAHKPREHVLVIHDVAHSIDAAIAQLEFTEFPVWKRMQGTETSRRFGCPHSSVAPAVPINSPSLSSQHISISAYTAAVSGCSILHCFLLFPAVVVVPSSRSFMFSCS